MREAVICEPIRTPVGRFGGMFRNLPIAYLGTTVITALVERTGIALHDEDVIFGQGSPIGEAPALDTGLDVTVRAGIAATYERWS